jgi:taurine dioxygenase
MEFDTGIGGCGAEVRGIQLAKLGEDELEALRAAFVRYGVLFFRDQDLSPEDHLRFARRVGPIVVNKFFPESTAHPEIAEVRKEERQRMNIGGGWHADHSYDEEPALGSILVARDLPRAGGDTLFAQLADAYDALSEGLKETLRGLRAVHSNRHLYGPDGIYRKTDLADQLGGMDRVGDATHPMVIAHPQSGRPALYVNPGHSIQIEGWTVAESRALLDFLFEHVTGEGSAFTTRFQWKPGSIAFWDNRQTWHYAVNDYAGERRLMHRITLAGAPLAAA